MSLAARGPSPARLAAAILTGGRGSRLGGVAKGTLPGLDGRPLAARLAGLLAAMGVPCALVGRPDDHASLGLPAIADRWPGEGPLGGLATACAWAAGQGADAVLVVACDLPRLERSLLERLAAAPAGAPAVVFRRPDASDIEPLPGRFAVALGADAARRLDPPASLARGARSLRGFLAPLAPLVVPLSSDEAAQLDDWDTPADVASRR